MEYTTEGNQGDVGELLKDIFPSSYELSCGSEWMLLVPMVSLLSRTQV